MPHFITLEGTDGAGKTTQLNWIEDILTCRGIDYIVTREPGGTTLGELIRDMILSRKDVSISPMAQLLLMFAAREQHICDVIKPALSDGKWVICDRFTDASYAYQGAAGGLGVQPVAIIEKMVQGGFQADLTILLDVSIELGETRINKRNEQSDRFESLEISKKQLIRNAYMERVRQYPNRIKCVDASHDIATVKRQIENLLLPLLP